MSSGHKNTVRRKISWRRFGKDLIEASLDSVPLAKVTQREHLVEVSLGEARIELQTDAVGGEISLKGKRTRLANVIERTDSH